MLGSFKRKGKASIIVGGQWGSEGKGAAAALAARHLAEHGRHFDIVTTSAGAQAGHTSTHDGVTRVVFHLPTAPLISCQYKDGFGIPNMKSVVYLNSGAVIDPNVLIAELDSFGSCFSDFFIHPNAAVITDECREAEMALDSAQTRIASTRKGVGEAISRRVLRSGLIARDCDALRPYVKRVDLNARLAAGASVLVEVPQGFSLSLDGKFYPHCTSRNCTAVQGMSDAGIHPSFYGETMMVIRTMPIRVGNIYLEKDISPPCKGNEWNPTGTREVVGFSGDHYPDQREISWDDIGVRAEITTVTKRVRRVFTFSQQQLIDAMCALRPGIVYVTFMDYLQKESDAYGMQLAIKVAARAAGMEKEPEVVWQYGPTTDDVYENVLGPKERAMNVM